MFEFLGGFAPGVKPAIHAGMWQLVRRVDELAPAMEVLDDVALRRLTRDGEDVDLTTGEFSMLKALARHPRQPLSRDKLARLARGREFEPFDRSLDVQVSRLRKLLEADPAHPRYIQTVWGLGYVFVPDDGH